jgi:hypothetical protein
MKSKLIAVLNSLIAILKKVTCNIIYYTPPLGLFSLLRHLQAEQIQFVGELLRLVDENGRVQFGDVTPFLWDTIYRWDTDFNGNAKAPHYTLYSIMSLRMYFIVYLCITLCQTVAIFILKTKLSQGFSKLNILSKLLHCFENTNIPSPCEEWDSGSGNASEHYERMKANKIENLAVIFTNFICNLLLLVPIYALGMKISERQGLLYETIGYLEEESLATVKVWMIAGLSLFFVIIFTLVEALLFILYNNKYHPFKNILLDMEGKENNNRDDSNIPMNDLS